MFDAMPLDPTLLQATPTNEGDLFIVSVYGASEAEVAALQEQVDAHFAPLNARGLVTRHEVDLCVVKSEKDSVLWIAVEDATAKDVADVQEELEFRLQELDPDVEGGPIIIANFGPELSRMSFEELEMTRDRIEVYIEQAKERRPTMSQLPTGK